MERERRLLLPHWFVLLWVLLFVIQDNIFTVLMSSSWLNEITGALYHYSRIIVPPALMGLLAGLVLRAKTWPAIGTFVLASFLGYLAAWFMWIPANIEMGFFWIGLYLLLVPTVVHAIWFWRQGLNPFGYLAVAVLLPVTRAFLVEKYGVLGSSEPFLGPVLDAAFALVVALWIAYSPRKVREPDDW